MSVKQQRSAATQRALVEAAIDLTLEHGATGWNLRDVMRRAGQFNNSVVQYHFGGFDELVRGAVDVALDEADGTRYSRFLACVLASPGADLVWTNPVVLERVGERDSDEARRWALHLLEHAFVDVGDAS